MGTKSDCPSVPAVGDGGRAGPCAAVKSARPQDYVCLLGMPPTAETAAAPEVSASAVNKLECQHGSQTRAMSGARCARGDSDWQVGRSGAGPRGSVTAAPWHWPFRAQAPVIGHRGSYRVGTWLVRSHVS